MNWDDLQVFAAVSRHGGISQAAQVLALDPATVSRRVKRLEEALGMALFARSSRGVVATDFGERLLNSTQEMETIARDITPDASQQQNDLRGTVRVGAPDGCANFLLPQVCADIQATNPELCFEIVPQGRSFDLQRREVDIALAVHPPSTKRATLRPIASYDLIFACHESLLKGREDNHGLNGLPLTSYIPELLVDPGLDIPADYRDTDPMLRSSSVMVQWQWICSGRAAGLLHDFTFPLANGLVHLLPEVRFKREYFLVSRRHDGKLTSRLLEVLENGLRQEMHRLRSK